MTPRRIGLLGGECTGKSSLARALAKALPACVADEALRDFVVDQGRTPNQDEQAAMFRTQQDRIDRAATTCSLTWLVADPAPVMTAIYGVVYFGDESLVEVGLEDCRKYDALVWCAPDIPWVPEPGIRDGADFRTRAHDVIATVARRIEERGVTLVTVSGTIEQRTAQCALAWQTPPHQGRT